MCLCLYVTGMSGELLQHVVRASHPSTRNGYRSFPSKKKRTGRAKPRREKSSGLLPDSLAVHFCFVCFLRSGGNYYFVSRNGDVSGVQVTMHGWPPRCEVDTWRF